MKAILCSLALGLSLPAQAQRITSDTRAQHVTTSGGKEVRVYTYARWRRDCSPDTPPGVTVVTAPQHGTASMRPGLSVVRDFHDIDCTGLSMPGVSLWYTPSPGFRGSDLFEVAANMGRRIIHDTVTVDVR